jgi:hypothetical protein
MYAFRFKFLYKSSPNRIVFICVPQKYTLSQELVGRWFIKDELPEATGSPARV